MISYPSTADALAKAEDYQQNYMDLSLPRKMWWHDYPYNGDFKIKTTWGKDDYFFAYALWIHAVEFSDPEDFGWGDGQIKPYKAWIFQYVSGGWEIVLDADSPLWAEDAFLSQRNLIKALP